MIYIGCLLQRQFTHSISHCFSVELEYMRIGLIYFDAEIAHRIGVSLGKRCRNAARAHSSIKDSDPAYLRIAKVMPIGIPFHIYLPSFLPFVRYLRTYAQCITTP